MPIDASLLELALSTIPPINAQNIIETSTDIVTFNPGDGIVLPEEDGYNEEVARKIKDLELKSYVKQLKDAGYVENPPIVGEPNFTSLVVPDPTELENCNTTEDKYKWVVTRLFKQTHSGVKYMAPLYDENNKNPQTITKLAGIMSQNNVSGIRVPITEEEIRFNERLINWALKSNDLSSSGTPNLKQLVAIANNNNWAPIAPFQKQLGELLTPVISYGMATHLLDWEEVGKAKVSLAQGYVGHVIKNIESITNAYNSDEECLRNILPPSSTVGQRPFTIPSSFNLPSPIPSVTTGENMAVSTFVERHPSILWVGGGTVGILCVGATIIGIIKPNNTTNTEEVAQIAKGIARLISNGFNYLGTP